MFGYVVVYVFGIATGVTLIWLNRKSIEKAMDEYKRSFEKEKQRLIDENKRVRNQLYKQCNDEAYREGFEQGRLDPYDEAERFARAMSGKQNMKFHAKANED